MKPKRILVTGAAGFIGMHQALRLLQAGHRVLGIDNLNTYYDPALKQARLNVLGNHPGFEFARVSLEDEEKVLPIVAGFRPEIIIHLAAQAGVRHSLNAPRDYTHSNIEGFLTLLEAARDGSVEHFVYASSSSVYGANTKVPFSEDDPVNHPVSLYAATKRANELMAETYAHLHRIPLTGLRFFTVYGPWGRPDMAMWNFTAAILAGEPIEVFDEANMSRDFTYVDDVVEAIEKLLPLPPPPGLTGSPHVVLNIGNNRPERLSDFIAAIEAACGKTAIKLHKPRQPMDVLTTYADISKLAALTGFRPKTSIDEGARLFAEWYRGWTTRTS
ncbi:MAG: NAD-dependent epimerase/dehydratase family protein [Rhabdaerophilum sp.]